jgi:hypothetical protein
MKVLVVDDSLGYPSAALQHVSRMLRAAWPSKHDSGSLTTCRDRIRAIQNFGPLP